MNAESNIFTQFCRQPRFQESTEAEVSEQSNCCNLSDIAWIGCNQINVPDSFTNAFLFLDPDVKNKIASWFVPLHTTPVSSAHDKLLPPSSTVCLSRKDRDLTYSVRVI